MVKKNIHLLPDSPYSNWFVSTCVKNANDTINKFYCLSDNIKYLKNEHIECLSITDENINKIDQILNDASTLMNLYVHYLDDIKARIINDIQNKLVTIIWIIWSEDLYQLPKLKFGKYDSYSADFFKRTNKITLKQRIGRLKMIYIEGKDLNYKRKWYLVYQAINKINYCCTGIEEEFKIVQRRLNSKIKFLPFAYINVLNDLPISKDFYLGKKLIQIGNSADPANNHFEIIKKIHGLNIKNTILLPLSYGDSNYKKILIKDIQKYFGPTQLKILEEMQEKEFYYENLSRVKSAIFGHNIQQAFGNIIALIYFGSKIFLKKENPLFKQFKKWGIVVFSIEKDLTNNELEEILDLQIQQINRERILNLFSNQKIDALYTGFLSV